MWALADRLGVLDSGDIGGDEQVGAAWSRRFVWADSNGDPLPITEEDTSRILFAVIEDAWFASQPPRYDGTESDEYDVTNMTMYSLCTDLEDIGGTEYDSQYEYNYVGDMAYSRADADSTAKQCAESAKPEDYTWNPSESPSLRA